MNTDPCPWCIDNDCSFHCPNAPDGRHEVDVMYWNADRSGDEIYIDVLCQHCNRLGCLGVVSFNHIQWD